VALISCSECGTEVSDKADACPKCGNPIGGGEITITNLALIDLEVYRNGVFRGKIYKGESVTLATDSDFELTVKETANGGSSSIAISKGDGGVIQAKARMLGGVKFVV